MKRLFVLRINGSETTISEVRGVAAQVVQRITDAFNPADPPVVKGDEEQRARKRAYNRMYQERRKRLLAAAEHARKAKAAKRARG